MAADDAGFSRLGRPIIFQEKSQHRQLPLRIGLPIDIGREAFLFAKYFKKYYSILTL